MNKTLFIDRFREAARRFPDHAALHYEDSRYTYRELDLLTDRLASFLKGRGIGPGSVVSVLVPRCEFMAIAALGILKTGAAYEPLDAAHPVKRIHAMIEDADAALVITAKEYQPLLEDLPAKYRNSLLFMEDIASLPEPEEPLRCVIRPDDIFVILYTSGSTGNPKGILLTHGNIISFADWAIPYYHMDGTSKVAEYVSFVFDVSMEDLLVPLLAGASVHIVPEDIRSDMIALKQYFDENGITHCSITTQMGRQFALLMGDKTKTLKHLTVAGEALKAVCPPRNFALHNGYGPTECCIYVTIFPVRREYPENVPIGYPLPEVEIYIVDKEGKMAPDGEPGELCIAGPHVAKGYLNHPELTEQVFTPNPFSEEPTSRVLYHTGDLARYVVRSGENGGGNEESGRILEYLGRMDRQVKIRGFRIEPAEIEALLQGREEIRDVVVEAPVIGNQKVLTAYYLSEKPVDESLLRSCVEKEKPSYMVPSFFIHMKEFPLTTNGKVNRKRLPLPAPAAGSRSGGEPVTGTEKQLARLMSEVLETEGIGREDNYYHLGGNSITAAALLFEIWEVFSVRITVKDILEYPLLRQLAQRIDELRGASLPLVRPLPPGEDYLVSAAQERIYTAQKMLGDDDPVYLLDLTMETEGLFDADRVKEVLGKLFARHESLRTGFFLKENRVLAQRILPPDEDWIREAVSRTEMNVLPDSFRLDTAPLFAWSCGEKKLSFRWHHIISDGRSNVLFAREFAALYNGESLPPLPVHQKEIADYERRLLAGSFREQWMENWRRMFADYTESEELRLPADGWMTGERRAGRIRTTFSEELSGEIDLFCRRNNITPYMFLLAVFGILLGRCGRQERIILGTVMDGREVPESGRLQGMFVNTVPLFLRAQADSPLSAYLNAVSSAVLTAMESQAVPLETVAREFEAAGGYSRTSHGHLLFDVLFVMQSMDRSLPDLGGSRAWMDFPAGDRAMYDLTLETEKRQNRYTCEFEYDASLYAEDTISYLARHYEVLVKSCLAGGDCLLSDLNMLGDEERNLLLKGFQPEQTVCGSGREPETVVELLERRVRENPDKTALVYGEESLSYRQLWEQSLSLSGRIRSMVFPDGEASTDQEDPERRVALIAERGPAMIVCLWAILEAGCTYVPISPAYPEERVRYLLEDCRPSLIIRCGLEDRKLIDCLEAQPVRVISCAAGETQPLCVPEGRTIIRPQTAAYMIYTSGTTGDPKGVVVEHRQLSSLLLAYEKIYGLTAEDTVLAFASFVFDQSVWDIFHILTAGGTLCLLPEHISRDPGELARYCFAHQVTAASLTPAFLRLLDPEAFPTLRLLDVGGEAPDRALLSAWAPGRKVFNTYGPTETTVNAASYLFSDGEALTGGSGALTDRVPIGRPVPGSRIYILNGTSLCGIGVPGELCIAGNQVARGYFHREALTAEVFTEDPFCGGRMYRSGDLARFLPDGNIDFLGRLDEQVKLRGFRIELREIESVLKAIPGIRDALVLVRKDARGEDQLCGYYLPDHPYAITPDRLRSRLEETLPLYMVPSFLIPLEAFPLTINGKVNRRALPEPGSTPEQGFTEPSGPEEQLLCRAFAKVLGTDRISVTEDFLAMGGDSIKAIRISALLRDEGCPLNANRILQYRTIRKLAPLLHQEEAVTQYEEYPSVRFTPVMKLFAAAHMPNPDWYNQSALLRLQGNPDPEVIRKALDRLVRDHGMLRLTAREDWADSAGLTEDYPLLIRKPEEMPAVCLPVYTGLTLRERRETCRSLQRQISPTRGEVMKAALFLNTSEDGTESRLFLAVHHLAVDEVSWGILTGDLDRILGAPAEDTSVPSTVSFGEWSRLLWEYRNREAFLPEKAYWEQVHQSLSLRGGEGTEWLRRLGAGGHTERTPGEDGPLSRNADEEPAEASPQRAGYGCLSRALPENLKNAVFETAKACCHGRADVVLLACLALAVKNCSGPESLILQMESHGRGQIEGEEHREVSTDRTVGWFTAVYPLMLDLSDSFEEQLLYVKEAVASVPNLGIGYGLLYDDLSRYGGIVFNYLGQSREESYEAFRYDRDESPEDMDPRNGDPGTISFDLRTDEGGLQIDCRYDRIYDEARIAGLLDQFAGCLSRLEGFRAGEGGALTGPSDLCIGPAISVSDWKKLLRVCRPEGIAAVSRLTPLQQGMLYRYIAEPDSRAYFLQDKLVIPGGFREELFREALRLCSLRFDALRLRFFYEDLEMPCQVILKEQIPEYTDASGKSLEEVIAEDTARGFLLDREAPIRFVRYRPEEGAEGTHFLVSSHHALMDGWSFALFIDTLVDYYRRLLSGEDSARLAALAEEEARKSCSYADYLEEMAGVNRYACLNRWESRLTDLEDGCGLPSLSAAGEAKKVPAAIDFSLPGETAQRLKRYLADHRITGGTFFGVLWAILLGMENGVSDVVFGETVSGRDRDLKGIEKAVGMLISTIPVRVRWTEETTAASLLSARQEEYYAMQSCEAVSLSEIGARTGLGARLIRTLYVYENYPAADHAGRYRLESLHEEVDSPAGLSVEESEGFRLHLAYDAGFYPEDYIRLLPGRLEYLAEQILAVPDIRVSDLERIPPEEKARMLGELAGGRRHYPEDTFLDMLYRQVRENPERPALAFRDVRMSYRELWDRAQALSEKIGFGGERYIAILTDRSVELIVSITAVLLSGAAYVPIDKDYPAERIRAILEDGRPEAVICREELLHTDGKEGADRRELFRELGLRVISGIPGDGCSGQGEGSSSVPGHAEGDSSVPGADGTGTEEGSSALGHAEGSSSVSDTGSIGTEVDMLPPPEADLLLDRIAYMIYTSGTTGKAKGVEIEHRSLSDMIQGNEACYGSFREDVVLLLLNPVFDASVQQIFPVLAQGGCLCILPEDLLKNPGEIADYCDVHGVTVLSGTNALLRTFSLNLKNRMRVMITGGDEAERSVYETFARQTDMLVNDYGPTEACVHTLSYTFRTEDRQDRIPLGRPYPNKRVYILQGDKLCGTGQRGEICIGGAGLARGYHNDPEQTAAAFVENPFDGGRMYRTGDMGIYGSDGNLYFEGRRDSQVKIRGFRIETEEIEACLKSDPEIEDALVVPVKDRRGETRLAAYIRCRKAAVTPDGTGEPDSSRLMGTEERTGDPDNGRFPEIQERTEKKSDLDRIRDDLKRRLPDYMIPSFFVEVSEFPLTVNGKIDTKKLPLPEFSAAREYMAPASYFEERIASLFERILGIDHVGRNDSFFELGGSSLDMMRLLAGLAGLNLRAADILAHPTPDSLGRLLRKEFIREQDQEEGYLLLQSGDESLPAIFCIPPSGGMTMCYLELLRELDYPGCVWGLTDRKYGLFGRMSLEELAEYDRDILSRQEPGEGEQTAGALNGDARLGQEPGEGEQTAEVLNGDTRLGQEPGAGEHGIGVLKEETMESYRRALGRKFRPGDILLGYSQGGNIAHSLSRWLEEENRRPGRLILLESLPFCPGDSGSITPESRPERLETAGIILFGQRELRKKTMTAPQAEIRDDISAEDFLHRFYGEQAAEFSGDEEGMLRAFYETYLVYSVNTASPFVTAGKTETEIDAILLSEAKAAESTAGTGQNPSEIERTESAGTEVPFRHKSPWDAYSRSQGTVYYIAGSGEDHLVFLSRYKKQIARQIRKLLFRIPVQGKEQ